VATLGGLVSWYGKVSRGVLPPWSIHHLVGELVTSSLAGLLCFWLCEWAGLAPLLTAALVGLSGHAGAKGIQLLENWAAKRFQERAGGAS
jgi:predicted CDP-diglyceride synthetase/phosphatidate cytidylyltransferase